MKISQLKNILKKKIIFSKYIYIVGHNNIDLDAFGAIVGINSIVERFHKKAFIIIEENDLEPGVKKAKNIFGKSLNVINMDEIISFEKSLLIIVDTNKSHLLACNEIIDKFSSIIVIDHHDIDKDTIKNTNNFIYKNVSSTCEIVTELIRNWKIKISKETATVLLSGIVLDTNSFILRVYDNTFLNAYYLSKQGASPIEVQYLLKQNLKKFVNREKMLTNVKIINKKIAIAKGVRGEIYRREDLAKIAETLLLFNNIETSFVIGTLDPKEIGISARTLGKLHLGKLMSNFHGGGNASEAAAKIESNDINEIENKLIEILKK